jgi:hypothetical protein
MSANMLKMSTNTIQAWWPRWFAWGLVGFADFSDAYYTTIDHQTVQDSNPRPCTHHH